MKALALSGSTHSYSFAHPTHPTHVRGSVGNEISESTLSDLDFWDFGLDLGTGLRILVPLSRSCPAYFVSRPVQERHRAGEYPAGALRSCSAGAHYRRPQFQVLLAPAYAGILRGTSAAAGRSKALDLPRAIIATSSQTKHPRRRRTATN